MESTSLTQTDIIEMVPQIHKVNKHIILTLFPFNLNSLTLTQ
jgi:hypothetical protein